MNIDLLIHSANQLLLMTPTPQRGMHLGELALIEDGALAVKDGKILAAGSAVEMSHFTAKKQINASGRVVIPGFVDPHTHLVWIGDRALEFEMRIAGKSYREIMEAGGGIISTMQKVRSASVDELVEEALPRLDRMLALGTTTAEAKTGYGLNTESELKQMRAILQLDELHPVNVVPTFLGAHAIPPEYSGNSDEYTSLVCTEMLPELLHWWQANAGSRPLPFVDVFCETGAFNLSQSRRILESAQDLGFPLKIHADEFDSLGGTALAAELGAVSADHLVASTDEDISALAQSDTTAVALPGTPFGLGSSVYTPAQEILKAGGILALATDLNPGTAWCESMQFVIALACRSMHLTPARALAAATINAAAALGRAGETGSLTAGKKADILILDIPDYRHMGYRFGGNLVNTVIREGENVTGYKTQT